MRDIYPDLKKRAMGIIEERRKVIMAEMEAGQGSAQIFPYPVSLEPPFKPFSSRPERPPFFGSLFQGPEKVYPAKPEKEINFRLGFIQIKPSNEDKNSLESAEHLILSLPSSSPMAFEVIGSDKKISFQLAAEESKTDMIVSQVRSHFPNAEVSIEGKDLLRDMPHGSVARAYRLKTSNFLPLCLTTDGIDPLRTLLGCLDNLEKGEMAIFQILFSPVKENWQDNMRRASRNPYDPSQSLFIDFPQLPKSVDKKLARPLFAVGLRIAASNKELLWSMERFLNQFENGETGIIPIPGDYPAKSIVERNTFIHGCLLSSTELSYLFHLPTPDVIDPIRSIEQARKTYPVPDEFTLNGPILGYNCHRGIKSPARHSPCLPNRHVYACGKSGYGKSNLILSTAMQRIERGEGVGVIDPHGSLIRQGILPRIPMEKINDVIYFNAGDFEYPMAINPLAHNGTKLEREHIRTDLLNFFEDLFESPLGVNVQHALNFFLITLLSFKDSTLIDMERLMIDKNWRNKLLEGITDERIIVFWKLEFPLLERRGIITAIMNKLSPILLPDSAIAPMLKQKENKIDFLKIMNDKKIFLGNLSHGDIGKRNSQLLGKLLVSKLQIAAMMREEGRHPDFYLFIDEFQHMACPSMADILSGARKYGLHLWLANQMIGDIPESILRHVFNASTLISFATDSPSDQLLIEKSLSKRFRAEDIGQLNRGETYVKMVNAAFNMLTGRMPEPPPVQHINEIVTASRERYATAVKTTRSGEMELIEKMPPLQAHRWSTPKTSAPVPTLPALSPPEKAFLECAYRNPALSVTGVYKTQGLSAYMGDKLKRALTHKGLLKEISTHLGTGSRIAKFLLLTSQGFNALATDYGQGKGGPLHRYWQTAIKLHTESEGYRTIIEEPVSGTKETVDLGLERDGKRTAVEISVTTKTGHEIDNAKKCLRARYDRVIVVFLEEYKLAEFQSLVEELFTSEEQKKISVGFVYDFCQILVSVDSDDKSICSVVSGGNTVSLRSQKQ